MVKILLDIPKNIMNKIALDRVKLGLNDKRKVINQILKKKYKNKK